MGEVESLDVVEKRRVQVALTRREWLALYALGVAEGGYRKVVSEFVRTGLQGAAAEVDDE